MRELLKKRLDNQNGIAMLLVLLVVAMLMGSAAFFLTHTSNASVQAKTTGELLDARLVSEAGIDYYSEQVKRSVAAQNNQITDMLNLTFPPASVVTLDAKHTFEIKNIKTQLNGSAKSVTFTSVGTAHGKTHETTKTITVQP